MQGAEEDASLAEATQGVMKIPLRRIVRAREDSHLVKLVLRRHMEGQLSRRDFSPNKVCNETPLGAFAGRCYGNVQVCHTCFCVYDLIEHATGASVVQTSQPVRLEEKASIADDILLETTNTYALMRAKYAMTRLTLQDVAELRSYSLPPPAVALVTTAMLILLTGGLVLRWSDARRAMANGESFLQCYSVTTPSHLLPRSSWHDL